MSSASAFEPAAAVRDGVDVGGVDLELGGVDGREKCIEPGYKCFLVHDAGHEHGFGEAGGEEVAVAGFVGGGAVFVFGEEAEGGLIDGGFESGVGGEVGGVEGEVHGEGGAGVGADADGIGQALEVEDVFFGELFVEGFEVGGELFGVGVVPGGEFAVDLEEPGVAVGALEVFAFGVFGVGEEGDLAGDIGWGEVFVEALADDGGEGDLRVLLEEVDEGPGGVDGGVPVEAAVEGAGLVVVVDGAALGVVNPEVVVGVVGGVLGVVDAGERKGGEGDDLGLRR